MAEGNAQPAVPCLRNPLPANRSSWIRGNGVLRVIRLVGTSLFFQRADRWSDSGGPARAPSASGRPQHWISVVAYTRDRQPRRSITRAASPDSVSRAVLVTDGEQ